MTDRPIIFSGPMVQALLAGRKTMTRRLALTSRRLHEESTPTTHRSKFKIIPSPWQHVKPGDRLWVREAWCPANSDDGPVVLTRADTGRRYLVHDSDPVDYDAFPAGHGAWSAWAGDVESGTTKAWRPSIHMPRWASRLTLIVTAAKIERLYDIGDDDVRAEGVADTRTSWLNAWRELWESINGSGDWDTNPEVVALTFRVVKSNIDQVPA